MKDSEFIELLNLYLDHEISPEKAARLEAEVTRDPARRQVYRQYCRMQKACVVLSAQFGDATPTQAAPEILAGRPARAGGSVLWATGLMAAACAAIGVFLHLRSGAPAAVVPTNAALAQSAPAAAPAAAPARSDFQPVFVARSLAASAPAASNALFSTGATSGQLAWIQRVQVTPIAAIAATPLFPDAKPALEFDSRTDRVPTATPEESAAFQFQR